MRAPSPSFKAFGPSRRSLGFTLLEMMIAVAVVGILTAIAVPSYKANVRSAQRANAAAALLDCSQKLERYYSQGMTYVGATVGATGSCVIPAEVSKNYTVSLSAPAPSGTAASTYTLTAAPNSAQSADSCKTLCVDSASVRRAGTLSGSGTTCSALIPTPAASSCF
jgi:type IV pilus assembly protein PilE